MSAAAAANVAVEQGTTYQLTLTWKDSTGAVIDMTGYRVHAQFRQHVTGVVVINADSSNPVDGITVSTPDSTGVMAISVAPSITSVMTGTGVYDLLVSSSEGVVTRLLQGTWAVSDTVTHD